MKSCDEVLEDYLKELKKKNGGRRLVCDEEAFHLMTKVCIEAEEEIARAIAGEDEKIPNVELAKLAIGVINANLCSKIKLSSWQLEVLICKKIPKIWKKGFMHKFTTANTEEGYIRVYNPETLESWVPGV